MGSYQRGKPLFGTFTALAVVLQGLVTVMALADEPQPAKPAEPPETITLNVSPASEPQPALKYRLLPMPSERTPGNAAQYYYRAMVQMQLLSKEHWKQYNERRDAWLVRNPDKYPREEVAKWLEPTASIVTQIKVAAYREYCDWDYRVQDLRGMDTINFLMPDVQECRQLARLLQVRAHHEIMEGRVEDALATLRLGCQLSQDVARTPMVINGLVGVAIAGVMHEELRTLIERTDANLYWALAALPRPIIDLRAGLQFESHLPMQMFPFLEDAESVDRSTDEWRRLIVECISGVSNLEGNTPQLPTWQAELMATAAMAKLYPVAKEQLLAGGLSREKIEAMPVGQVVAIHTARATKYAYDQLFKLALLPAEEALPRLPEVMKELEKDIVQPGALMTGRAGIPIAALLLPSLEHVIRAELRITREYAALQAIEAARMHAAANNGKIPAALADVKVVPVPKDAATGQAFAYTSDAQANTATFDLTPIAGVPPRGYAKRYVIRVKGP